MGLIEETRWWDKGLGPDTRIVGLPVTRQNRIAQMGLRGVDQVSQREPHAVCVDAGDQATGWSETRDKCISGACRELANGPGP